MTHCDPKVIDIDEKISSTYVILICKYEVFI